MTDLQTIPRPRRPRPKVVTLTEAAADDPVLGALPPAFAVFQWHSDTFTLPDPFFQCRIIGPIGIVNHE
mgnify:CR=1 FL=1